MNMPDDAPRKRGCLHLATIDVTPLRRHRDFRLLFIGRLVSFFGSMISSVAVPCQVYQLTHSVLLVGSLGLVELRGRLASIELLSYSIGPTLRNFEAGVVASLFSIRTSIVSGGVLCVVGCVACALLLPAFRNYGARVYHLPPDPVPSNVKRERQ